MATKLMDIPPPKPRNGGNKSSMPSIVSEGLHISGNLFSDGDVQIDGRIEGDIQGRNVTVGAAGAVIGKLNADEANISGSVTGEIIARAVTLARTAKVQCDIVQETLVIEAGAMFEGNCKRTGTAPAKGANGTLGKSSELLLSSSAEVATARAHD